MLGRRVRHAGGAGTVTAVGNRGVTVDHVHKIEHGHYRLDDDGAALEDIADGYARFVAEVAHDLELGAGSRAAKLAAMAALLDEDVAKRPTLDPPVHAHVLAIVRHLKGQPGPRTFVHGTRGADAVPLTGQDVDAYLERWGLSRATMESYWVNRALVEHAAEQGADADLSAVDRLTGAAGPRGRMDPAVVSAIRHGRAARATGPGTTAERAAKFAAWVADLGGADAADRPRPGSPGPA